MQLGLSVSEIQLSRMQRQELLGECARQRDIARLLPDRSSRSTSPNPTLRQRVGGLLVDAGQRLLGAPAVPASAPAA